jgi:hypothetical protein
VLVPSAFITGISGQFYVVCSPSGRDDHFLIVSPTLSPRCALLLKRRPERHEEKWWNGRSAGFPRLQLGLDGLGG